MFYFVSYESIRDHKAVDNTVSVPLPAMLKGDLSLSPDADLRPALGKSGRHRSNAVPGIPWRSELRAVQHGHQPELPEHHSRGADGSDRAARSRATFRRTISIGIATTISCRRRSRSTGSRSIRGSTTTATRSSTCPGRSACCTTATNVPTVFGDTAVGRNRSAAAATPGTGHGNTYRVTVIGTYIFSPTFLMDAHFG